MLVQQEHEAAVGVRRGDKQTRCNPQINSDKEQANRKPAGVKDGCSYSTIRSGGQPSQTSQLEVATTAPFDLHFTLTVDWHGGTLAGIKYKSVRSRGMLHTAATT